MTVNRQEFLDAIIVATLLDDVIILNISEKGTSLSNKPSVKGNSVMELNATVNGPDIRIGLHGAFLKDSLQALKNENVTFHFHQPKSPVYAEEHEKMEFILPVVIQTNYSDRDRVL